jgi:hypothetical protein
MPLSNSEEIKTVTANAQPPAGETEELRVDAQEDREIIGWEISPYLSQNEDQNVRLEVYTGSHPRPSANSAEDLGGKFFISTKAVVNNDDTNNVGWSVVGTMDSGHLDSPAFDWNEDVTLTFECTNQGDTQNGFQIQVYYREV